MTKVPHLVVAGYLYESPHAMGRLPLRVFLVDRKRLQEASALRLGHDPDGLRYRYRIKFPTYEKVMRLAASHARQAVLLDMAFNPLEAQFARPRAHYRYSYLKPGFGWRHRFKVTNRLSSPKMADVPFRWNPFLLKMRWYSVTGIFEAECINEGCNTRLRLELDLYVDPGSFEPFSAPETPL